MLIISAFDSVFMTSNMSYSVAVCFLIGAPCQKLSNFLGVHFCS